MQTSKLVRYAFSLSCKGLDTGAIGPDTGGHLAKCSNGYLYPFESHKFATTWTAGNIGILCGYRSSSLACVLDRPVGKNQMTTMPTA